MSDLWFDTRFALLGGGRFFWIEIETELKMKFEKNPRKISFRSNRINKTVVVIIQSVLYGNIERHG